MSDTFCGNDVYSIDCTGDVVVGDHVCFSRATFSGSYKKPKFTGYQIVTGEVVADSYGRDKQQHTFTIELANGGKTRIKGRNLYDNGVWRKPWEDEAARNKACDEKHARGEAARTLKSLKKEIGIY